MILKDSRYVNPDRFVYILSLSRFDLEYIRGRDAGISGERIAAIARSRSGCRDIGRWVLRFVDLAFCGFVYLWFAGFVIDPNSFARSVNAAVAQVPTVVLLACAASSSVAAKKACMTSSQGQAYSVLLRFRTSIKSACTTSPKASACWPGSKSRLISSMICRRARSIWRSGLLRSGVRCLRLMTAARVGKDPRGPHRMLCE